MLLASATDKERKWMDDYRILSLDQIKTKSDLYENVVKFVLAKHQLDQKDSVGSETMIDVCIERLGKYAFDIFSNNKNPKIDKRLFDANLAILFMSKDGGNYDFIHKSFYEFFLARHLSQIENGE